MNKTKFSKLASVAITSTLFSVGILTTISFLENEEASAYGPYVPKQEYDTLIVETDKSSYTRGETIIVTGTVQEYHDEEKIRMIVSYPNGRVAEMLNVEVSPDKNFSISIDTNDLSKNGKYEIKSHYGKYSEISEIYFVLNEK